MKFEEPWRMKSNVGRRVDWIDIIQPAAIIHQQDSLPQRLDLLLAFPSVHTTGSELTRSVNLDTYFLIVCVCGVKGDNKTINFMCTECRFLRFYRWLHWYIRLLYHKYGGFDLCHVIYHNSGSPKEGLEDIFMVHSLKYVFTLIFRLLWRIWRARWIYNNN